MYHAGWAWAGSTPFQATKLVASHFGGTRNPMVISWPKGITPDTEIRSQFSHVIDIAPTIYDILGITPPETVNGQNQIPIDGHSFAAALHDANAAETNTTQFFDNNGSRAIYKDGWMASAFGPFLPWNTPASGPRVAKWDSATDDWELYHIAEDFSQANDLAAVHPEKLQALKEEFLALAEDNNDFPIGAGNWLRLHPNDRIKTPYKQWSFTNTTQRMPEFTAPGLGRESNKVTIDVELSRRADGVIYALGGAGGGLTLYMDKGRLVYLYNMMIIEQYSIRSKKRLNPGQHTIEVITDIEGPGKAGTVTLMVDGQNVGQTVLARTVPAAFSAGESFDVGMDLGSTVADDYYDRRPFRLEGTVNTVNVSLN